VGTIIMLTALVWAALLLLAHQHRARTASAGTA
jgi:cell division protein FtsL